MTHKDCGGYFMIRQVMGHGFCFMECMKCGYKSGGEKTQAEINRLMSIKVRPWIQ